MDKQNFPPSIYDRVKTAIKSLNLDQYQLAEKLGITQAAISKALNGKSDRSLQRLVMLLSKEYGIDFEPLQNNSDQREEFQQIRTELKEMKESLEKGLEELKEMISKLEK
jgi:transcriptional regulator with XRE-family HTH domain